MNVKFTAAQRRIFIACFLSYACAYIGRLNLSAALNSVIGDMHLTDAQGGLFVTCDGRETVLRCGEVSLHSDSLLGLE